MRGVPYRAPRTYHLDKQCALSPACILNVRRLQLGAAANWLPLSQRRSQLVLPRDRKERALPPAGQEQRIRPAFRSVGTDTLRIPENVCGFLMRQKGPRTTRALHEAKCAGDCRHQESVFPLNYGSLPRGLYGLKSPYRRLTHE